MFIELFDVCEVLGGFQVQGVNMEELPEMEMASFQ